MSSAPSSPMSPTTPTMDYVNCPAIVRGARLIDTGRPAVEHRNLPGHYYRGIWQVYFLLRFFGKSAACIVVGTLVFSLILGAPLGTVVGLVLSLAPAYHYYAKTHAQFRTMLKREQGHEFVAGRPFVSQLPSYKCPERIFAIWAASPYRKALLTHAAKSADPAVSTPAQEALAAFGSTAAAAAGPIAEWDRVDSCMFPQPIEGYCAPATVNTFLQSIPHAALIPLKRMPGPASIHEIAATLESAELAACLTGGERVAKVESIYMDPADVSLAQFKQLIKRAADADTRVLANFLRAPLFLPLPTTETQKIRLLMGGHWSPIIGVDAACEQVLVADVNSTYGPYLCPVERLYDACRTKDGDRFRGLVIATIAHDGKKHAGAAAGAAAPGAVSPKPKAKKVE